MREDSAKPAEPLSSLGLRGLARAGCDLLLLGSGTTERSCAATILGGVSFGLVFIVAVVSGRTSSEALLIAGAVSVTFIALLLILILGPTDTVLAQNVALANEGRKRIAANKAAEIYEKHALMAKADLCRRAPPQPRPSPQLRSMTLRCKTCDSGTLVKRNVYRLSPIVVLIGYILLIPSILGMVFCLFVFSAAGTATATSATRLKDEVTRDLRRAEVPEAIITRLIDLGTVPNAELRQLTERQQAAVSRAQTHLSAGTLGAGIAGAIAGGTSICLMVSFLVSGLLGWLLVMRKRVLQCNQCGAIIAAS